jgi:uncharacterized membrane protein YfcA
MNISAYGQKFFIFGGALLIAIALVQLLTRPRKRERSGARLWLDATTIRAIFFATMGLLTFLVGIGVIPIVGGP